MEAKVKVTVSPVAALKVWSAEGTIVKQLLVPLLPWTARVWVREFRSAAGPSPGRPGRGATALVAVADRA